MLKQLVQYGSLAAAHARTFKKKVLHGSKPAKRVFAAPQAADDSSSWYEKCRTAISAYCQAPTLIRKPDNFPAIYIGSGLNAASSSTYETLGIDCVLNCASNVPAFCNDSVTHYQHLPMDDDADGYVDFVNDDTFRTRLYNFLHQLWGHPEKKLLVHCVFGRSRSVAVTTLILFLLDRIHGDAETERRAIMPLLYQSVYDLRPVVHMNGEFFNGLCEFENAYETHEPFRRVWRTVFMTNVDSDQEQDEAHLENDCHDDGFTSNDDDADDGEEEEAQFDEDSDSDREDSAPDSVPEVTMHPNFEHAQIGRRRLLSDPFEKID